MFWEASLKGLAGLSREGRSRLEAPVQRPMPELDGMRGLAALIVLVSHYSNDFGLWNGLLGQGAGQTGVMLFFVLSGFLMTHLHVEHDLSRRNLRAYGVRRLARVYPMFVVAAAAFVFAPAGSSHDWPPRGAWTAFLRQIALVDPGISVLWTIRIEIGFYVMFVAIWFLHRCLDDRRMTAVLLAVLVVLGDITRGGRVWSVMGTYRYFLFGVISSLLMPRRPATPLLSWSLLSMLVLVSLPLSFPHVAQVAFGVEVRPWENDVLALQILLLFNLAIRRPGWLGSGLATPVMRWIGRMSYSLYLFQPFVLQFVADRLHPGAAKLLSFAAVLACALAMASLSRRLLEAPAQRLLLTALMPAGVYSVTATSGPHRSDSVNPR